MKLHKVKTWPCYYKYQKTGIKPFEIRNDDRGYKEGDVLLSQEWCPDKEEYTGDEMAYFISYIMRNKPEFLAHGMCAMGLEQIILTQ